MRFSFALLAVAVSTVSATVATYDSSLNMTIDVSTVDAQTRGMHIIDATCDC